MDNSRSLEALYQDGTGMVSLPKKSYKASIEGYDGFDDILSADLAKSEENLAFLDTFQMIEAKNAADKIKMCKKLSANYGTRSGMPTAAATSVESLCHMMSLEEAANAEAAGVNTGNEEAADKPETETKKLGFFKTVFGAIRGFFEKIWQFFMKIISKISSLFKKKTTEPADTSNVNVNASETTSKDSSSNSEGASDIRNRQANTNTKLNLDYIVNSMALDFNKWNPSGIKKFTETYTKTATSVNSFASKLRKTSTVKDLKDEKGNKISDGNGGFKKEDQSVANTRRNELMEKEGKALIDTIDATSSIVKGVADRRTTLGTRGDAKSIKAALDAAGKDLTFEKGSDNAYAVMESLFGLARDKKLESLAEEFNKASKNKGHQTSMSNYLMIAVKRMSDMREHVIDTIQNTPSKLKNPHDTMVRICSEFEKNINNYVSSLGKHSASEFYTNLTVMAAALKVCTKMEQVVVKACSVLITYMNAFKF